MNPIKLVEILTAHAAWLRDPSTGQRANLTGVNLTMADLTGVNLTWVNLTRVNLTRVNLTRANLTGVNLTRANLTGVNLTGANLTGVNLTWANLTWANFTGADLTMADLTMADLTMADLTMAIGFRFADAPDPRTLRAAVADKIEAHPELHDQGKWGDGSPDPSCGAPCCVAGWACHLGGGARGDQVLSTAIRLLWLDGAPMPSFDGNASREEILAALRAVPS